MSTFDSPPDDLTRESFNDALADLLRAAVRENIDVCGGYRVETSGNEHAFGVEIYHVLRHIKSGAPEDDHRLEGQ